MGDGGKGVGGMALWVVTIVLRHRAPDRRSHDRNDTWPVC